MVASPIKSMVAAVTVYNQGARVTRVADLVRAGDAFPDTIRLTGLPLTLRDDSIRVRVDGDHGSDGLPSAVDIKIALDVPDLDESLRPADDAAVQAARADEARCAAEVQQLERELARLNQLELAPRPRGAKGEPPPATPLESRLALLEMREQLEKGLHDELAAKRDELRTAQRRRQELEDQDARATTARQAREHELRKTVIVTLRPPAGQAAEVARIALDYLVPGARWAPSYAVYFDDALTRAELRMRAAVAQDTGEDWSGVPLTLSTADAQSWTELPELRSVRIGRYQPPAPRAGWRPPPTGVEELFDDYDRSFRARFFAQEPAPAPPMELPVPAATHREDTQPFEPQPYLQAMLDADQTGAVPLMAGAAFEAEAAPPKRARRDKQKGRQAARMSRSAEPARPAPPPPMFGAPAPMMAPQGAAPAPAAKSTMVLGGLEQSSAYAEREEAGAESLRARDDMLDYGGLRMPSARSRERGSLVVASRTDIYMELLVQHEVQVSFDVGAVIAHAVQRAQRTSQLALPTHCQFVWSETYDYAYATDTPVDVPSDGTLHSIPLLARSGDARLDHVVVPRESCDVFRQVEVTNPLDAPLLPGPIDVYKAGDYLLTSKVELTPPRASLQLGLGVEQRVKVSRNTFYREDAAGLIKGSLQLNHQILIEAINHLSHPVELEVRERIPIARTDDDDIKVTVREVEPRWETFDPFPDKASSAKLKGGYRWRVTLGPAEKQHLKAAYEVRISAKHQLVGGNRREA